MFVCVVNVQLCVVNGISWQAGFIAVRLFFLTFKLCTEWSIYFLCRCCKSIVDQSKSILAAALVKKNAIVEKLRQEEAVVKEQTAVIASNKKAYLSLREEAKKKDAIIAELRLQNATLERTAAAAASSKGGYPLISRTINTHSFPLRISKQSSTFKQEWRTLYPTHDLTWGLSGEFVYGEPSLGTMGRICSVISSELAIQKKPLCESDILLDWGCGAGKWLIFARDFLRLPRMKAIGIESEQKIFDVCCVNVCAAKNAGRTRVHVLHARSESFDSFCPARVVLNYDGSPQKPLAVAANGKGRIHKTIMRNAFCSPTVDVIVSTRLNEHTFKQYFHRHLARLRHSVWKCIFVPACDFGGNKFATNVWFRLSPMQMHACDISIDPRMQLVSGA